jgi:hypothetical protein
LKQEKAAIPGVDDSDVDQSNIAAAADSSADDDDLHSEDEDHERLAITKELEDFIKRISDNYKLTYIEARAKALVKEDDAAILTSNE